MRETRLTMGMPVTVEVPGDGAAEALARAFDWFDEVDARFSPFRPGNEVAALNAGRADFSPEMEEILALARETGRESFGYFDIRRPGGGLDPSGIVKGWAIARAAAMIRAAGHADYLVEAGGDIQSAGRNAAGQAWRVGIRNPFDHATIVQVIRPDGRGVATSGSYIRGAHVWDPVSPGVVLDRVLSLTVVGPDVLEADRFATAAFAMGEDGIAFIEDRPGLEGYMIDIDGMATMTSGFAALAA